MTDLDRRAFIKGAALAGTGFVVSQRLWAADDFDAIRREIAKGHDKTVRRLQEWIQQPSIAAENRGMTEGCDLTIRFLKEAGFDAATKVATGGPPGIFATLDAGAKNTVGLYFMYDVKQATPGEWSSPPWAAALVDNPDFGKVIVGRGAVNQKGPQNSMLAALHAFRGAGRKIPVNIVLVAEGEEEIGSPHFLQVMRRPEVRSALSKCLGIFMPTAAQGIDGVATVSLGAKGVIECELVSSGAKWGRGPRKEIHSSNKARLDSPVWHLVQALATLVSADGDEPAIDGFADKALPISPEQKQMIAEAAKRMDEAQIKKAMGVERWINDVDWVESLERLISRPTVNIEGLVSGYTGPGGKTILPNKATAKLDLRLVPNMTAAEAGAALRSHLAKRGFGDIEVDVTGGYDPNSTSADSALIKAQIATYKRSGVDPILWPRNAGSWPGYVFTNEPLKLPAGHFGLGHGSGAHAADEYYLIDSTNPKVQGMDGAVLSFAQYLYELAL